MEFPIINRIGIHYRKSFYWLYMEIKWHENLFSSLRLKENHQVKQVKYNYFFTSLSESNCSIAFGRQGKTDAPKVSTMRCINEVTWIARKIALVRAAVDKIHLKYFHSPLLLTLLRKGSTFGNTTRTWSRTSRVWFTEKARNFHRYT